MDKFYRINTEALLKLKGDANALVIYDLLRFLAQRSTDNSTDFNELRASKETGMSRNKIRRCIKSLIKYGLVLKRDKSWHGKNEYKVLPIENIRLVPKRYKGVRNDTKVSEMKQGSCTEMEQLVVPKWNNQPIYSTKESIPKEKHSPLHGFLKKKKSTNVDKKEKEVQPWEIPVNEAREVEDQNIIDWLKQKSMAVRSELGLEFNDINGERKFRRVQPEEFYQKPDEDL